MDVSVGVAEGTWVGKNWVGVGSRVGLGRRGVKLGVGRVVAVGVLVRGGTVASGVGLGGAGGGALANAMIPKQ